MASAAVQHPSLPIGVDSPQADNRYSSRKSSATPPLPQAFESYTSRLNWPISSYSTSNVVLESDAPDPNAVQAARNASSNHAKLHKRVGSKTSVSGRKHSASLERLDTSVGRQSSGIRLDSPADASKLSSPSKTLPRDRLKALKKLTSSSGSGGDDQGIDLSLTAAENEERSGLGIMTTSLYPISSSTDYSYSGSPLVQQHSTISLGSPQSPSIGSFRPTAPYVFPMRPTPRPSTPPLAEAYTNSMMYSDFKEDVPLPMKHNGPEATGGTPEPFPDTASITSSTYRRPNRVNTSDSLSRLESGSQTNVSTLSGLSRPRRSTNRSAETATPPGIVSMERKHSFGFGKKDSVDPAQRAASISAARQAFAEREETKARKYDLKEQKSAERRTQKRQRHIDKKGRKSEPSIRTHERQSSSSEGARVISGPEYRNLTSPPEQSSQQTLRSGRSPPIKDGYMNFLTWMKVRMMRMGGKRKQSR